MVKRLVVAGLAMALLLLGAAAGLPVETVLGTTLAAMSP